MDEREIALIVIASIIFIFFYIPTILILFCCIPNTFCIKNKVETQEQRIYSMA